MNSEVVWKPIPGYEQMYEISNTGFVRNVHTGLIKSNGIEWNRMESTPMSMFVFNYANTKSVENSSFTDW